MTQEKMYQVMNEMFARCHKSRRAGQLEYAHDQDNAFRNFDSAAERLGYDRKEILWIFLDKHLSGILAHIKGHRSQREGVEGRIGDAITYLCLLQGMIDEEKEVEAGSLKKTARSSVPNVYSHGKKASVGCTLDVEDLL